MRIVVSLKTHIVILAGVFVLGACASHRNDPLVGAHWMVLQDVTFPRRNRTVLLQDGGIVERSNRRDRFVPHCAIVSTQRHEPPLMIKKGARFKVQSVSYPSSAVNETTSMYETVMQVFAETYPDVRTIRCTAWSSQSRGHMSTEAMQNAMQGWLELDMPAAGTPNAE